MRTHLAAEPEPRARAQKGPASKPALAARIATADDHETRQRLLTAAERLFADRGFKKVTVREICLAARANVAAVNYHFGDKLGLYREVLQVGDRRDARDQRPPRARPASGTPPRSNSVATSPSSSTACSARGTDTVHRLINRENHPIRRRPSTRSSSRACAPRIEYLSGN